MLLFINFSFAKSIELHAGNYLISIADILIVA